MTCIVAYKTKDHIWMGADSYGMRSNLKQVRRDRKLFCIDGRMLLGFTTSFRMGQLLKWKFELPKHPSKMGTERYMNTLFVDAVSACFKDNGYAKVNNNVETGGNFLVAYRGRVFEIDNDYQVGERIGPCSAVGCGEEPAMGAMYAMHRISSAYPYPGGSIVTIALQAAASNVGGVGPPFHTDFISVKTR